MISVLFGGLFVNCLIIIFMMYCFVINRQLIIDSGLYMLMVAERERDGDRPTMPSLAFSELLPDYYSPDTFLAGLRVALYYYDFSPEVFSRRLPSSIP
jgi:hypothetical protein